MKVGIIGGSGLEKGDFLGNLKEVQLDTPYGRVDLKKGESESNEIYVISRHGENHEITPTNVNNKANIYALGNVGCKYILATTAVGSLKEDMKPGDFVIPDQFIDFTKHRKTTFFEDFKEGVNHTSLADPFSEKLRNYLSNSCKELGFNYHEKGTVITIEGPRFSTRAESKMFQNFADIINMSTAPEAILAKEAGVEYATIAMVTDYDCWKQTETPVTWEEIKKTMSQNSTNVKKTLENTIQKILSKGNNSKDLEEIKNSIRTVPNFPKPGIMFRDITTLLENPEIRDKALDILEHRYQNKDIDVIAGIDARGFIFGGMLADRLKKSLVLIRKKGKLPHETISQEYKLEYGTDTMEAHKDSISPGQKVLIVDDLLATGGTGEAAAELIEKLQGEVVEFFSVIGLPDLKGKEKLSKWPVYTMIDFEGE